MNGAGEGGVTKTLGMNGHGEAEAGESSRQRADEGDLIGLHEGEGLAHMASYTLLSHLLLKGSTGKGGIYDAEKGVEEEGGKRIDNPIDLGVGVALAENFVGVGRGEDFFGKLAGALVEPFSVLSGESEGVD